MALAMFALAVARVIEYRRRPDTAGGSITTRSRGKMIGERVAFGARACIGLREANLRLAAFRIAEVALRLGIVVRRRYRRFARLLAAFGLALLFFFGPDATLFLRRQPWRGLQRLLDLRQSLLLVAGPIGLSGRSASPPN